ncbi:MAG: hydrogenase maturation protease [Gammaproteobacteria bacterium]
MTVIGIGNRTRGDDAAGLRVIDTLGQAPPRGVRLLTAPGDMLALLDLWGEADDVILVDAMAPAGAPGRVLRLDAGNGTLATALGNFASSHAFNLAEAVELGRALGRLPARLVIYGIEGACFEHGAAPSAAVEAAVGAVGAQIRQEIEPCTKPL